MKRLLWFRDGSFRYKLLAIGKSPYLPANLRVGSFWSQELVIKRSVYSRESSFRCHELVIEGLPYLSADFQEGPFQSWVLIIEASPCFDMIVSYVCLLSCIYWITDLPIPWSRSDYVLYIIYTLLITILSSTKQDYKLNSYTTISLYPFIFCQRVGLRLPAEYRFRLSALYFKRAHSANLIKSPLTNTAFLSTYLFRHINDATNFLEH